MRPLTGAARRRIAAGSLGIATTLTGAALAPAQAENAGATIPVDVADRSLRLGDALKVRGKLGAEGAGQTLVLEQRPGGRGGWQPLQTTNTDSEGRYRFRVRISRSGPVRVRVGGYEARAAVADGSAAASLQEGVSVGSVIRGASRAGIAGGSTAVVRGELLPRRAGRTVRVEVRRNGRWRTAGKARTRSGGKFTVRFRAGAASRRYRVRFGGDALNSSSSRSLRVQRFRRSYASWYGPGLYGNRTACGGTLTPGTMGVAHKTLRCGTKVTFRYNGRSVTVPVIDRGPYVGGREWDLTGATARQLGFSGHGAVWSSV